MSDQLLQQIDELLVRRLGTMEESINSKMELLAEGQQAIVERMDRFEVRLDSVERTVTEHTGQLAGLAADLKATNARIDGVEQSLSARIDGVEQGLSARIDGVEQSLSVRIDGVEQNLSAKIDAVAADLAAHRRDTEAHGRGYLVSE